MKTATCENISPGPGWMLVTYWKVEWNSRAKCGIFIFIDSGSSHFPTECSYRVCSTVVTSSRHFNIISINLKVHWLGGHTNMWWYEGVAKSFQTSHLEWELQMVQLSATRCSCIAILWVSLVSFSTITLHVASQGVFIVLVYFIMIQSRNFWIHPHIWILWIADTFLCSHIALNQY
jgi:hypothetical protein